MAMRWDGGMGWCEEGRRSPVLGSRLGCHDLLYLTHRAIQSRRCRGCLPPQLRHIPCWPRMALVLDSSRYRASGRPHTNPRPKAVVAGQPRSSKSAWQNRAAQMEELPPRERGQRLLELVPRLTFDEVRRLRARLDEVDFRTDVFGRLPLELQCPIAEQLDGGDLWPCLIVSRRWRAVFLSECVLISLARSRFPGLLECVALEGRDATDAFVTAARKRFFRSTGRFRSALRHRLYLETETIFRLDAGLHPRSYPDEQDDGRQYSQILVHPLRSRDKDRNSQKHSTFYANGRLAWQPSRSAIDKSLIVVDDLRSQRRKVFRYPGIAQIGYLHLVALGECLVVGVARSTLWGPPSVFPAPKTRMAVNTTQNRLGPGVQPEGKDIAAQQAESGCDPWPHHRFHPSNFQHFGPVGYRA